MRRIVATIGGIVLAVVLSQFPEYAQQYEQRLGGAVDELRILTVDFDSAATSAGLTRPQAIARYEATGDDFVAGRGRSVDQMFARYAMLSAALARVEGAQGIDRALMLPSYADPEIAARTLEVFEPAVPVTAEGLAYAGVGFVVGYLLTSGIARFLLLPFRRRRRSQPVRA